VQLLPAPRQGGLLIVAEPGDRVSVDGRPYALGPDAVVEINAPEGFYEVLVQGGGREARLPVAVSDGDVTWARPPAPAPAQLQFAQGSAALSAAERARLAPLVERLGGWVIEVEGGFSPEGDRAANLRLAEARADAALAALRALGVPEAQLRRLPPAVPEGATSAAGLRVCVLRFAPGDR
jgi:hypothetical protein